MAVPLGPSWKDVYQPNHVPAGLDEDTAAAFGSLPYGARLGLAATRLDESPGSGVIFGEQPPTELSFEVCAQARARVTLEAWLGMTPPERAAFTEAMQAYDPSVYDWYADGLPGHTDVLGLGASGRIKLPPGAPGYSNYKELLDSGVLHCSALCLRVAPAGAEGGYQMGQLCLQRAVTAEGCGGLHMGFVNKYFPAPLVRPVTYAALSNAAAHAGFILDSAAPQGFVFDPTSTTVRLVPAPMGGAAAFFGAGAGAGAGAAAGAGDSTKEAQRREVKDSDNRIKVSRALLGADCTPLLGRPGATALPIEARAAPLPSGSQVLDVRTIAKQLSKPTGGYASSTDLLLRWSASPEGSIEFGVGPVCPLGTTWEQTAGWQEHVAGTVAVAGLVSMPWFADLTALTAPMISPEVSLELCDASNAFGGLPSLMPGALLRFGASPNVAQPGLMTEVAHLYSPAGLEENARGSNQGIGLRLRRTIATAFPEACTMDTASRHIVFALAVWLSQQYLGLFLTLHRGANFDAAISHGVAQMLCMAASARVPIETVHLSIDVDVLNRMPHMPTYNIPVAAHGAYKGADEGDGKTKVTTITVSEPPHLLNVANKLDELGRRKAPGDKKSDKKAARDATGGSSGGGGSGGGGGRGAASSGGGAKTAAVTAASVTADTAASPLSSPPAKRTRDDSAAAVVPDPPREQPPRAPRPGFTSEVAELAGAGIFPSSYAMKAAERLAAAGEVRDKMAVGKEGLAPFADKMYPQWAKKVIEGLTGDIDKDTCLAHGPGTHPYTQCYLGGPEFLVKIRAKRASHLEKNK